MKQFLAIIPARGGSKRLPKKNILPLCNKPLIAWTIEAAQACPEIDDVCVTTDDENILAIAQQYHTKAIKRPAELASDTATTFDAIQHALESLSQQYEYVVLLQPTSPLRHSQNISEAIQFLQSKKADAVISVCEVEHSPLWSNTLPQDLSLVGFLPEQAEGRSQDLPTYYRLNGAIYICKTEKLLDQKSLFLKENIFSYIMEKEESIDIDDKLDFLIAEQIMQNKS